MSLAAAWAATLTFVMHVQAGTAGSQTRHTWPTSPEARRFHFPHRWLIESGVWCIHRREAVDWHERRNSYSRGGMQIVWSTWTSVGGRGDPADWSVREQVYRAFLIWKRDNGSWREWTTARRCGLR